MPKTVISQSLLRLMPEHRLKEKRTTLLTLDELIDDYRKVHELSPSDLDFVLMGYRYEHLFQNFLNKFTSKEVKPVEIYDLWRLAFASLLTRKEDSIAQLTHAWVEASKAFFGEHTSGLSNAFCRKVLREKEDILAKKTNATVLGQSLSKRWKQDSGLQRRFSAKVLLRPEAGIGCLDKNGQWQIVNPKIFTVGTHLAISKASADWVNFVLEKIKDKKSIKLLDACAAPGGKFIATLNAIGERCEESIAVEAKFKRMERLKENLQVWGYEKKAQCVLHDWSEENPDIRKDFDLVIADLPCTGLGTLASRPDLLLKDWSQDDASLFALQKQILDNVSQRLTKNGLLCVSICSSDPSEIQHINQILNAKPSFRSMLNEENSEEITGWVIIKE